MANFDSAKLKHISKAKELAQILSFYSYSSEADAVKTGEKLMELLIGKLRESKQNIFDIVQFVYQIQEDKRLDSIFEPLRDEIDLLGDEVKVSFVTWQELPERFWELVIAHDLTLADSVTNLAELAVQMRGQVSGYTRVAGKKEFDMGKIERSRKNMESLLDGIRRAFKEREAILGLKKADLDRDFKEIRKRIEESI